MEKSSKKWLIPVIAAVAAVAAVVVLMLTGVIGEKSIKVPDVLNKNVSEAEKILEEAGLSLLITKTEINNDVDENTVLEQSPNAGEKAEEGAAVNVTVSEKSVEAEIPNVKYYDRALAIEVLTAAGFKTQISEEENTSFADDTVFSQSASGKAFTGETVVLSVAKNDQTADAEMIDVLSVVNKTPEEAAKIIDGKFYLKITEEQFSNSVEKGKIISQNPQEKMTAQKKSTIKAVISKGKASDVRVTVPSVIRFGKIQAKEMLEKLGLRVTVKEEYSDTVASGIVIKQSIQKGETVAADTEIIITVSCGKTSEKTTAEIIPIPSTMPSTLKETTTKSNSQTVTQQKPSTTVTQAAASGESKYTADFRITTDKSEAKAGDIVTVSVKLKTNYNIVTISLPVIYDARVFEIADANENNVSSYLTFTGTLKDNAYSTNGNWKSPDTMYKKNSNPDYWTDPLRMSMYKIAFATWVVMPSQGTVVTKLGEEETIVTFRLKVKEDAKDTSGRIFLHPDFIKTEKDPQGILSVGRLSSDEVSMDAIVATGQTINLGKATTIVVIK